MSRTIFKYPLEIKRGVQRVAMTSPAIPLAVGRQGDDLVLWAIVGRSGPSVERCLEVFGTGWDLPEDVSLKDHVGTVQHDGFVWHVFVR